MRSRMVSTLAAAALIGIFAGPTLAANPRHPGKAGATPKAETFMIVQVGDEFRVIPKSSLTELQRSVKDTYQQESKSYQEAKKEATKKKEKFDQVKPVKPVVKSIKAGFKDEQQASQEAAKLQEKLDLQKKTHPSTTPAKTHQP
ncbi:MAG: hypothetical protein LLF97_11025 [Planctomycetaceae bacterium]|nr:hypothetical protein [Planctomycetaceae bacterium]